MKRRDVHIIQTPLTRYSESQTFKILQEKLNSSYIAQDSKINIIQRS
jgi:hypothetical protein